MKRLILVGVLWALPALAQADVSKMYDVSTDGSSTTLKAGEKGKLVIAITTKAGAHVSDEAPLKIEVSSKQGTVDKQKLTMADTLNKKKEGGPEFPDPRFEVGFTPSAKGKASVDAKMTFFVCTDKICARQTKQLSVPVDVK